jgi:hypothetical protein
MNSAFTSDECNLLERALDAAWDIALHSGQLDGYRLEAAKSALTRAILSGYEGGERNTNRLAIAAVAQLEGSASRFADRFPQTPAA